MASGGYTFNDFPEIVQTREITTKIDKTFFSRRWPWAYFLNGPNAATSIAPTLMRLYSIQTTSVPVLCSIRSC